MTRLRRQLACSPAHLLLLPALLLLASCASRSLTIQSKPTGADVFVDGEYAGRTPVTIPFVYGGEREILLYRPRMGTETRSYRPKRVIYDTTREEFDVLGVDLIADIAGSEDKQTVTFELKESNDAQLFEIDKDAWCAAARARAQVLRVRSRELQLGALPSDQGRDPGPLASRPTSRPEPLNPSQR